MLPRHFHFGIASHSRNLIRRRRSDFAVADGTAAGRALRHALWRSSGHPRMSGRYIKAVARRTVVDGENQPGGDGGASDPPSSRARPEKVKCEEKTRTLGIRQHYQRTVGNDLLRIPKGKKVRDSGLTFWQTASRFSNIYKRFDSGKKDIDVQN